MNNDLKIFGGGKQLKSLVSVFLMLQGVWSLLGKMTASKMKFLIV